MEEPDGNELPDRLGSLASAPLVFGREASGDELEALTQKSLDSVDFLKSRSSVRLPSSEPGEVLGLNPSTSNAQNPELA